MPNTTTITAHIERARKVLQYEQRSNHQDKIVQGGLELFASRWAEDFSTARKEAGLDLRPLHRLMEHLEGYRQQDPLQRSTNIRAALSILDEMEHGGASEALPAASTTVTQSEQRAARGSAHTASTPVAAPAQSGQKSARSAPAAHVAPQIATPPEVPKVAPDLKTLSAKPAAQPTHEEDPLHLDRNISAGHASLTLLRAEITAVPGVGTAVAAKLHSLGLRTMRDLLFYFP
ncbi:MAG TPA: hypothetical protein VHD63_28430, partial [Ktedonobacteraceae bacterium]|nr:hypothetical protein [Ktedonobacteraceae bacterium]